MAAETFDHSWMWHPCFPEIVTNTAGRFVHFRRTLPVNKPPPHSLLIHITADTRYKLHVNGKLVSFGPVKGDANLWFYDEVDIAPYLKPGDNLISVHVLRLFYGTSYGTSFPRLGSGGLRIRTTFYSPDWTPIIESSRFWEAAIDYSRIIPIDQSEDDFLHVYERSTPESREGEATLGWVPVKLLQYQNSTGVTAPWKLSPRVIPHMRLERKEISAIHNVESCFPNSSWMRAIAGAESEIALPPNTAHQLDLEMSEHTTAFIKFRFERPKVGGACLSVTYSESYEDTPKLIPYLRCKQQRCDTSKALIGPKDMYIFEGQNRRLDVCYHENEDTEEIFVPFHWRTFRFVRLHITTRSSDLTLRGIDIDVVQYPLQVSAQLTTRSGDDFTEKLFETSLRTLQNCMHDCYEDCPFYEQLQYAIDTRSSALFTYYVSADDRLAKQAIIQLYHSFQPTVGLTASRAPSHQLQIIPHFSLYWVCMLRDHLLHYNDRNFIRKFLPVMDAVLGFFHSHISDEYGLVALPTKAGIWNFHDWTDQWRPYGIPPSVVKSGISTYTNNLYAYVLGLASNLQESCGGRPALAEEYMSREKSINHAVRKHCFNGTFFTDSLATGSDSELDISQHGQVWAVLSGAVNGEEGQALLRRALMGSDTPLIKTSISMSFYTLRAISKAGFDFYNEVYHGFWDPWRRQLDLGLTTWVEDDVSNRSDCHAWGSAPIYELLAEVAGIRPAEDGWARLEFAPRVSLYPTLNATIPFCNGGNVALARVGWDTGSEGEIGVSLSITGLKGSVPVHVKLPGKPAVVVESSESLSFTCKLSEEGTSRYNE